MSTPDYRASIAQHYPAAHALYSGEHVANLKPKPGQSKIRAWLMYEKMNKVYITSYNALQPYKQLVHDFENYLLALKLFHKYYELGEKPEKQKRTKEQHIGWLVSSALKVISHLDILVEKPVNGYWQVKEQIKQQLPPLVQAFVCFVRWQIPYTPVRGFCLMDEERYKKAQQTPLPLFDNLEKKSNSPYKLGQEQKSQRHVSQEDSMNAEMYVNRPSRKTHMTAEMLVLCETFRSTGYSNIADDLLAAFNAKLAYVNAKAELSRSGSSGNYGLKRKVARLLTTAKKAAQAVQKHKGTLPAELAAKISYFFKHHNCIGTQYSYFLHK